MVVCAIGLPVPSGILTLAKRQQWLWPDLRAPVEDLRPDDDTRMRVQRGADHVCAHPWLGQDQKKRPRRLLRYFDGTLGRIVSHVEHVAAKSDRWCMK